MAGEQGVGTGAQVVDLVPIDGFDQCLPLGEVAVQRADPDAGPGRDGLQGDVPAFREGRPGGLDQPTAVRPRVCWVAGRSVDRARATAAQIGGRPLRLDVTDPASVAAASAVVAEVDVVVNNAGISPDHSVALAEADADLFRRTYETNVFGVVTVTNAFLPALRRSRHPRIVNVSSGTSSLAWSTGPNPQFDFRQIAESGGRLAAYRSSKTALNALTLIYAQALASDGIKVNALAPGVRATSLNPGAAARGGDPAEAAAAIVSLAQLPDDGPTGQFFSYDGSTVPW